MEPDRPFKHVEVVDTRTDMSCKVACMACIRGHRATSCGSSSCRQKVFWTVKRPGRPSNACSCRYGGGGTCKCNLVQTTCPHRVKGSKRSVNCRCQEQGRYCCYIDQHQWEEMYALRKPRVTLFSSREEMDAAHSKSAVPGVSPTPSLAASTQQMLSCLPSTPEPTVMANGSIMNTKLDLAHQQSDGRGLRFAMMGVGGPWGSDTTTPHDALQWQGLAPEMSADYSPFNQSTPLAHSTSSTPHTPNSHIQAMSSPYSYGPLPDQNQTEFMPPITNALQDMHMAPDLTHQSEPAFDIDKLMADYVHYQSPSAICQKCGLNGCTCRNCPPVMQNANNSSWGYGCSRKHVRPTRPAAATATAPAPAAISTGSVAGLQAAGSGCCSSSDNVTPQAHQRLALNSGMPGVHHDMSMTMHDPTFTTPQAFRMDDFEISAHDPQLADLQEQDVGGCCGGNHQSTDLSEMLIDELHSSGSGCCYGEAGGAGG